MTTPDPSMPEPGAAADAPERRFTLPTRELVGLILLVAGLTGVVVMLPFVVPPKALLLIGFAVVAGVGAWLSSSEV